MPAFTPGLMFKRVPQPPVRAALRDPEQHDFWPGLVLSLVAALLLFGGARHVTGLETDEGGAAREIELVRAFARGGLERVRAPAVIDPAMYADPLEAAAALERLAQEDGRAPRAGFRVNTGAADPCPT